MRLKVGDNAPAVEFAPSASGESFKLAGFKGKKNVLLAFYPRAFTPGCTTQMCGYRDDIERLSKADLEVIAISNDKQEKSDRFKDKHELPFHVAGDPDETIIEAFGIPFKSTGKSVERSVVLIDKKGVIRYLNLKYSVSKSKDELYEAIASL